jgi:hypothetical protein
MLIHQQERDLSRTRIVDLCDLVNSRIWGVDQRKMGICWYAVQVASKRPRFGDLHTLGTTCTPVVGRLRGGPSGWSISHVDP